MSANPRYRLISEQILAARGEDIRIDIAGSGAAGDDRRLDPARGGVHEHPVPRADLARPVRGVLERLPGDRGDPARGRRQLAVPLGKELWRETRIPLFEQATDTRSEELKAQGVRPAGVVRRALDHLGLRPVRGERPLLPGAAARSPTTRTRSRCSRPAARPQLSELRLHNGTIYRWNRPVYDVAGRACRTCGSRTGVLAGRADGRRHDGQRRVLLRAGPRARRERAAAVVADVVQRGGGELPRRRRARHRRADLLARVGQVRATELVLRRLLPMARAGARARGACAAAESDRLLGIIEQRCLTGTQRRGVVRPPDGASAATRSGTTRCAPTLLEYRERMHTNEPVHTWD